MEIHQTRDKKRDRLLFLIVRQFTFHIDGIVWIPKCRLDPTCSSSIRYDNTLLHSPFLDNSYAFWVHDIPNRFLPPTPQQLRVPQKVSWAFLVHSFRMEKQKGKTRSRWHEGRNKRRTALERYVSSICVCVGLDCNACKFVARAWAEIPRKSPERATRGRLLIGLDCCANG
jgi:hypothetical protein